MSISFIKKALFVDMIQNFEKVKRKIINKTDSLTASKNLMKSHLTKHVRDL